MCCYSQKYLIKKRIFYVIWTWPPQYPPPVSMTIAQTYKLQYLFFKRNLTIFLVKKTISFGIFHSLSFYKKKPRYLSACAFPRIKHFIQLMKSFKMSNREYWKAMWSLHQCQMGLFLRIKLFSTLKAFTYKWMEPKSNYPEGGSQMLKIAV